MRPSDRHTFKDRRPFQAEWEKPGVSQVDLSQHEIDGIMAAESPEDELRKVYLERVEAGIH